MSTNTESDNADAKPTTTPDADTIDTEPQVEPEEEDEVEVSPDVEAETEPVEPDNDDVTGKEVPKEADDEIANGDDAETEGEADAEDDGEAVVTGPPQQFQAAIKGGAIKEFVGTLRAIVDEAKIRVDPDGIQTRAVDPANVAMYDASLAAGAFESYDATDGVLGVNLKRFAEILKLAKKDDLVQLSFNTTTFKLVVHIDGVEFTMALIDPDSIRKEPELPDMDLPVSFTIEEAQIRRSVKAADMVADHIRFRCEEAEETVFIEAEGDTDNVSLELTESDLAALTAAEGQALYSLDYVKDISKQFPRGTEITLTFGSDFPMMIEYEFSNGECEVLAMLAPRIQSD
ncbi:DNA polymerase sliding clamp (plasmid) [Halarchaeum sp. CBA1220]|uniref:DNA polymerase sliding clamp n=1 Tax=Halarchaeum sp. CBA1220 TaxID=1853682 RepID=UPI000F3AA8E0|nr:DNA polymerase sliding clamp [Halarchaeum sp. CBA1220]QLC35632.1 DNA polymerase sliding clamp [Halarchaeum sp. CBA1220]